MTRVYLSIGSNHNCERNIAHAVARLREVFSPLECSPAYRSPAVDGRGPDYQNMAVGFDTALSLEEVRQLMHDLEAERGRDRTQTDTVSIDLDILLYGDRVGPRLPHPDVFRYRHVLQPLADIAGELIPPGSEQSINELLLAQTATVALEPAGEY